MGNNNDEVKKESKTHNINDAIGPIIFGLLAVIIMALAAHFMG